MYNLELDGKPLIFAPQTSLNAINDGQHLFLVYKSTSGTIKVIEINENNRPRKSEQFNEIKTIPRSAIAASLAPPDSATTATGPLYTKIVLFYQYLNLSTRKVNLGKHLYYILQF